MLLTFICGWSASDRTRVAGAAASRDVRVILTAVTAREIYSGAGPKLYYTA